MIYVNEVPYSKFLVESRAAHHRLFARIEGIRGRLWKEGLAARELAALEHALLHHLSTEEQFLIPWCELERPDEVVALRLEHKAIRDALCALCEASTEGVPAALEALSVLLQSTSKFQPGHLYSEADDLLQPRIKSELIHRFQQVLTTAPS